MTSGKWLHDIESNATFQEDPGGLSVEILNSDLVGLFRTAFTLIPSERPTARDWENALDSAQHSVVACPACGSESIAGQSEMVCTFCKFQD